MPSNAAARRQITRNDQVKTIGEYALVEAKAASGSAVHLGASIGSASQVFTKVFGGNGFVQEKGVRTSPSRFFLLILRSV